MIEDIYNLGESYSELENISPNFIQNPNADKVICIEFENKDGRVEYKGVWPEDFKKDEWKKYLYRRKSSQGVNFTPSAFVTKNKNTKELDPAKTFKGKILQWFEENTMQEIENLKKVMEIEKDNIIEDLEDLKSQKLDKNNSYILTIKVDGKYLDEVIPFNNFLEKVKERFFECGGEAKCIICNQKKKLGGRFSLSMMGLEFCTFDKRGFAPSLVQENGWKEISVCLDCAAYIELGKFFLDKYLNKQGFGFKYYIIPSFLLKKSMAMKKFIEKISKFSSYQTDVGLYKGLITKEDKLYNLIKDEKDRLQLSFLIYQKPTAQKFLILSYVGGVRPSWLNKIYNAERSCREEWIFKEKQMQFVLSKKYQGNFIPPYIKTKNGEISWWVFWIRNIFLSKREYIEILSNILSNRKISFSMLVHNFNIFLQKTFKDKDEHKNLNRYTLQTLAILLFLKGLNLLRGEKMVAKNLKSSGEIFEKYGDVFSNNERKIAFLIGALANYVLYIQRTERNCKPGEEPFRRELNNLLIDQKRLQKIFVKCVEKLNQYGKNVPNWLPENLRGSLGTKERWGSSTDVISYFFTLGLVLGNLLINKKENEVVENE